MTPRSIVKDRPGDCGRCSTAIKARKQFARKIRGQTTPEQLAGKPGRQDRGRQP